MTPSLISFTSNLNLLNPKFPLKEAPTHSNLKFRLISADEFGKISLILKGWTEISVTEKAKTEHEIKQKKLQNCTDMCRYMQDRLTRKGYFLYGVEDERQQIQSLALAKNIGIYSSYDEPPIQEYCELSAVITQPQQTGKGAAQFLIREIALSLLNISRCKGLFVESLDLAIPLFKRMGFELEGSLSESQSGPIPMILSKEKSSLLL